MLDQRAMPTIFLNSQIEQAIIKKDNSNLLFLLLVSVNDKEWSEVHPEHLKLFLEGLIIILFFISSETNILLLFEYSLDKLNLTIFV